MMRTTDSGTIKMLYRGRSSRLRPSPTAPATRCSLPRRQSWRWVTGRPVIDITFQAYQPGTWDGSFPVQLLREPGVSYPKNCGPSLAGGRLVLHGNRPACTLEESTHRFADGSVHFIKNSIN